MDTLEAGAWAAIAAASLWVGAEIALRRPLPSRTVGLILGFGAGALISAIAYELIPKSESAPEVEALLLFGAGALTFYVANDLVEKKSGGTASGEDRDAGSPSSGRGIVLGALLDGIPESLVLGMGIAVGGSVSIAFLAAVVLSNLPEGIAATVALVDAGTRPSAVRRMWWTIIAAAGVAGVIGAVAVDVLPEADGHLVEAFAAGAVLTMLTGSLLPEAFDRGGKVAGLLSVLGFTTAGMLSLIE